MIPAAIPTMDSATGQRVPDVDAIRAAEGFDWFGLAKSICCGPWIAPDPTLPALDVYILSGSEVADADALCGVCQLVALSSPVRRDCESCASGAAA